MLLVQNSEETSEAHFQIRKTYYFYSVLQRQYYTQILSQYPCATQDKMPFLRRGLQTLFEDRQRRTYLKCVQEQLSIYNEWCLIPGVCMNCKQELDKNHLEVSNMFKIELLIVGHPGKLNKQLMRFQCKKLLQLLEIYDSVCSHVDKKKVPKKFPSKKAEEIRGQETVKREKSCNSKNSQGGQAKKEESDD